MPYQIRVKYAENVFAIEIEENIVLTREEVAIKGKKFMKY